jgi:hypothetical protein
MDWRTFLGRRTGVQTDRFRLQVGVDGLVHEECWFCGNEVQFRPREPAGSDAAVVLVEPLGGGEAMHGVCHAGCAERARGSLMR